MRKAFFLILMIVLPLTALGVSDSVDVKLYISGPEQGSSEGGGMLPIGSNYKYDYLFEPSLKILSITSDSAVLEFTSRYESSISVLYGDSPDNLSNIKESFNSKKHIIVLDDLESNKEYYFLVEYRKPFGTSISSVYSFKTLPLEYKIIPNVLDLKIFKIGKSLFVLWRNPEYNFQEVIVVRGVNKMPTSIEKDTIVYRGKGSAFFDFNVKSGNRYYYTIFVASYDGKLSSGVSAYFDYFIEESKPTTREETGTLPNIEIPPPSKITPQKALRDYSINYLDLIYFLPTGELMFNDFDINNNEIVLLDNEFLRIIIDEKFIKYDKPDFAILFLSNKYYFLSYDPKNNAYSVDIVLNKNGTFNATIFLVYGDETIKKEFKLHVVPHAKIYGVHRDLKYSLNEVKVELFYYNESKKDWELWNSENYSQINPLISKDGRYFFLVGNGKYKIKASKRGYKSHETDAIKLEGYGFINQDIFLEENLVTYITKEIQILLKRLKTYF
mgnify:CR=1 FL=1